MNENILEYPGAPGLPDWDSLYRARGDEVQAHRSVFTGDAYLKVEVQTLGATRTRSVMILQHPCALRTDGISLHPRLLVAEIRTHREIPAEYWKVHVSKMPLPELIPDATSGQRHQAAFFDELYLVAPENLIPEKRIACMSQAGVNLLLQRWVHHNSRMVVPTWQYQETSSGAYEESDLIEEWCEERMQADVTVYDATVEAMKWLREDIDLAPTRQQRLGDPQQRSAVRREMRGALRSMR
jgi:hypothetical protein